MSSAAVTFFPPVAGKENLDRLAVFTSRSDLTRESWIEVHNEVQSQFASLECEVRRQVGDIRVDFGCTRGDRFFLFTYRTFSLPANAVDPVVAGMTFTPSGADVNVEADVSGEETGDLILSLPGQTVARSREVLLGAAQELARQLCVSADRIAAALKDPSRKVE